MSDDPGRWVDRLTGWCFGILFAAIALYCAVQLVESVLPALAIIVGIITLFSLLIGAFVVISTWRNRW